MKVTVEYMGQGIMAMDVCEEDCFGADGLRFIRTDADGHHAVPFAEVPYEAVVELDADDNLADAEIPERVWAYLNDGEHAWAFGIRSMSVGDKVTFRGITAIARGFGFARVA